jgi:CRP-like cAMP-binding protein
MSMKVRMNDNASKQMEEFFSQYPIKQYHKGQILIYSDEDPAGVFYLVSGMVRKYDIDKRGDEVVLNVFMPSVFFPMSWAINKTPNRYFFEALTPIEVRRAPVADVDEFLQSHPELALSLLRQVYLGLETAQRRIVHLMGGDTRRRLLYELLVEARRFGSVQEDGSTVVLIGMNDLSQRAGLSRERISREFAKLTEPDGVLIRHGRHIIIRSLSKLEEELEETPRQSP